LKKTPDEMWKRVAKGIAKIEKPKDRKNGRGNSMKQCRISNLYRAEEFWQVPEQVLTLHITIVL